MVKSQSIRRSIINILKYSIDLVLISNATRTPKIKMISHDMSLTTIIQYQYTHFAVIGHNNLSPLTTKTHFLLFKPWELHKSRTNCTHSTYICTTTSGANNPTLKGKQVNGAWWTSLLCDCYMPVHRWIRLEELSGWSETYRRRCLDF